MAIIDSLVSYYKLDESSGAVLDANGSNDGTNYGATPNVAGKINTAYDFDGSNDYISIPDDNTLDITSAITLSAWVKLDSTQSLYPAILVKGEIKDGATDSYGLRLATGDVQFIIYTGTFTALAGTIDIKDNAWHYLVATYDGTNMRIYVDGEEDTTVAKTGNINTVALPLQIGQTYNHAGYFLDGLVDEVAIFNTALTSTQITFLYNSGSGVPYPLTEGEEPPIKIFDVRFG